jgi:hypothetical protein
VPSGYQGTLAAGSGYTTLQQNNGTSPADTEGVVSTLTGTYAAAFTLTSNADWCAVVATFMAVQPPVTITATSLANGTENSAYSATLTATGGTVPYTWSIAAGTLPAGLALAPGTGVISGTPTGAGTSNFTVQVTDANSQTATASLSLTVIAPPSITTASLPGGTQSMAYSAALAVTGGTAPYSWSITSGTLHAGLALAPATGAISGTPTGTGTSNFTVQVTDANSLMATASLSLTVIVPPSITTASLPGGTQNMVYSAALAVTGGTAPYSWSIISGTLPEGLALASGTGVISGTPTETGTSNFTVQVIDANLQTATIALSLTINTSGDSR